MPTRLSARQTRAAIEQLRIERPLLAAFALSDAARHVRYAMHTHSRHQLILATAGSFWVETPARLHMCDASVGVLIPAGCRHATTVNAHGSVSLFFSPGRYRSPIRTVVAVTVTPLLREMAIAAAQGHAIVPARVKRPFFDVLFALAAHGCRPESGPVLPVSADSALAGAVQHLLTHLVSASVPELARVAALSERTLRRRFVAELHLTPEQYIQRARLLRAAQVLASEPRTSVTEIAAAVGYTNQSAFSAAFRKMFGMSPVQARRAGAGNARGEGERAVVKGPIGWPGGPDRPD